jgi:DNA-binding beta-propeller fold protein YncE
MATIGTATTMPRVRRAVGLSVTAIAVAALLGSATPAPAAPTPNKLLLSGYFGLGVDRTSGGDVCTVASGHEVNLTEVKAHAGAALENVCTIASGDECQPGKESHDPGGFAYPSGIAVAPNGHVYVADTANSRVQELAATGVFGRMFGWKVDKTTGANVCASRAPTLSRRYRGSRRSSLAA